MSADEKAKKKKKKVLTFDSEGEEPLEDNFNKALSKNQFVGEKGKMLLDLQTTYKNDSRFKIDKKFKGDISFQKLPSSLKSEIKTNLKKTNDFEYKDRTNEKASEEIQNEKNKNLSILSSVLPASAYLDHNPKEKSYKHVIVKRFDPDLNLGDYNVTPIEKKEDLKSKDDNVVKLEKGVEVFNEPLKNPIYQSKHQKQMKKREKEKMINKVINEINDNMNGEVIVNYDVFKKTIQESKQNGGFKLFGGSEDESKKEETQKISSEKNTEKNTEKKKKEDKDYEKTEENIDHEENEKEMLKRKKKREKKKEKQKVKKEKEKEKKTKKQEKEEEIEKKYISHLTEEFGDEKTQKYLKYIGMVRDKNKKKKK